MKNDGKQAERFFEEYWTRVGHCERLRDRRDLIGLNGGARVADFAKPSDFIVSRRGIGMHYAEVKSTQNPKRFEFKCIQAGQHKAAILEASRGCGAYHFYVFAYATGSWYKFSCDEYAARIDAGERSIPFEELKPWNP